MLRNKPHLRCWRPDSKPKRYSKVVGTSTASGSWSAKHPNWASDIDEQSLTFAQAKTKLARTFGADPSNIKITVEA